MVKPPSNNKQKVKPKGKGKGKGKTKEKKNRKSKEATINGLTILSHQCWSIAMNLSLFHATSREILTDWWMDTGCSQHVTSHKEDYAYYWKFPKPGQAKLARGCCQIVPISHTMTNRKHLNITLHDVLYIPKAIGRFFSPKSQWRKMLHSSSLMRLMSMLTANKTTFDRFTYN